MHKEKTRADNFEKEVAALKHEVRRITFVNKARGVIIAQLKAELVALGSEFYRLAHAGEEFVTGGGVIYRRVIE